MFVGQAFLCSSILFGYATLLSTFFNVSKTDAPYYLGGFAAGNLLGPLLLGRRFDLVGRRPMIAGTYILSGVRLLVTPSHVRPAPAERGRADAVLGRGVLIRSAGVSAAYLTVSEIFPMETGALCIALFYAGGTGLGGIVGPHLFAPMIATGKTSEVFKALAIGAILMIVGGVTEIASRREGRAPTPGGHRQANHRGRECPCAGARRGPAGRPRAGRAAASRRPSTRTA